jgi:hypothetical protein
VIKFIIAYWEESNKAAAIKSLRVTPDVNVNAKRDGTWKLVGARELVPGDILHRSEREREGRGSEKKYLIVLKYHSSEARRRCSSRSEAYSGRECIS